MSVGWNMKSVQDHKEVVEAYIGEERQAGRLLGPFCKHYFTQVQVSPFGVIPKSEVGKWTLILDLSSPEGFSVNDRINRELCSLSCMSVDDVARRVGYWVWCGRTISMWIRCCHLDLGLLRPYLVQWQIL